MFRGVAEVKRVAALGAGVIGAGWIAAYLARGYSVAVFDPASGAAERVDAHVERAWPEMQGLGLCSGPLQPGRLHHAKSMAEAVQGADLVQESTVEDLAFKVRLLADIDAIAPADVIIASSTSSLPVSALQASCRHPERCVLGHPYNPVHLMPLVEIGGGERTGAAAVDAIEAVYRGMGKRTIRVRKEIFGHIANRLTSAMFREAVALVEGGFATVEEVDDALRFGPALKWAIQGQFTTFHTTGGSGGLRSFLDHFSPGIMKRWSTMTTPDLADPGLQALLMGQLRAAKGGQSVQDIAQHQDALLTRLLLLLNRESR